MNLISDKMQTVEKSLIRRIYDSAPANAINLGLGEMQFPMPMHLREAAQQLLQQTHFPYTPNAGLPELRKAVAQYHHHPSNWEGVCITNGAEEAIYAILTAYLNPGDTVLLLDPGYSAYATIVHLLGGNARFVNLDADHNFAIPHDILEKEIRKKPKMLLFSHPSNPTGAALDSDEISWLRKLCAEEDVLLVVDEVYRELYLETPIGSFYHEEEPVLIISGLSKSHCMTGWRLGWVIGKPELVKSVIVVHQYISTCAGFLSQQLAIEALSPVGLNTMTSLRSSLQASYMYASQFLKTAFPAKKLVHPNAGFYLFLEIGGDDVLLAKFLAEQGLITAPGSAFGNSSTGWLRISYGLGLAQLTDGLNLLVKAYQEWQNL